MTARTFIAMMLMTTLTACMTSQPALTVARGDPQRGAVCSVYLSDARQISGELLAVDDTSVVLLMNDRIALVPTSNIRRVVFDDPEIKQLRFERRQLPSAVRTGREASRFPYGLTAPMMATLLANAKQVAPDRIDLVKP